MLKVEIGLARGKSYDKRQDITKDQRRREAEQDFKVKIFTDILYKEVLLSDRYKIRDRHGLTVFIQNRKLFLRMK